VVTEYDTEQLAEDGEDNRKGREGCAKESSSAAEEMQKALRREGEISMHRDLISLLLLVCPHFFWEDNEPGASSVCYHCGEYGHFREQLAQIQGCLNDDLNISEFQRMAFCLTKLLSF